MIGERRQEHDRAAFLEPPVPIGADRFGAKLLSLSERAGSQFADVTNPQDRMRI